VENLVAHDERHPHGPEILALLAQGQVPLWTAVLDNVAHARLQQLASFLSPDEHQRALRFRFERDRNRFIACRGILREILGACLRKDPGRIDFDYGCQGKPYLKREDRSAPESLYFNVSHSHGWAITHLG
jgi:4'-phosphopantetheinyl transferase